MINWPLVMAPNSLFLCYVPSNPKFHLLQFVYSKSATSCSTPWFYQKRTTNPKHLCKMYSSKCLRFGHWLTLCTPNIHLLTYLLRACCSTGQQITVVESGL